MNTYYAPLVKTVSVNPYCLTAKAENHFEEPRSEMRGFSPARSSIVQNQGAI